MVLQFIFFIDSSMGCINRKFFFCGLPLKILSDSQQFAVCLKKGRYLSAAVDSIQDTPGRFEMTSDWLLSIKEDD